MSSEAAATPTAEKPAGAAPAKMEEVRTLSDAATAPDTRSACNSFRCWQERNVDSVLGSCAPCCEERT